MRVMLELHTIFSISNASEVQLFDSQKGIIVTMMCSDSDPLRGKRSSEGKSMFLSETKLQSLFGRKTQTKILLYI